MSQVRFDISYNTVSNETLQQLSYVEDAYIHNVDKGMLILDIVSS